MNFGIVGLAVAGGAAFVGVFSVFIAAFLLLAVVTLRWAVRRDRVGRDEWAKRRSAGEHGAPTAPAQTNGHEPHRRDQPRRPDQPRGPDGARGSSQGRGRSRPRKNAPGQHRGPGARG